MRSAECGVRSAECGVRSAESKQKFKNYINKEIKKIEIKEFRRSFAALYKTRLLGPYG